ncbi:MAG: MarR family transcriptional regulator [Candidatus Rokubacteria bacterium]|nr:MarR family transcriptional regulator [Candidatus Rokubacteria bacterium]
MTVPVAPPKPRPLAAETERLVDLLNAVGSTAFRQLLWQRASELDLTFAQSQVLFYVAEHPGCPMGDVAKAFAVTLPAITHIVDRLEQKELAGRHHAAGDRRVYALELTAQGRALVDELHTLRTRALSDVLVRLSADDRRQLVHGLEALVDAASRRSEEARS